MSISTRIDTNTDPRSSSDSIFTRILVGIDGTQPSFEACRQVAQLANTDAAIEAAAVVHLGPAVAAALDRAHVADVLEHEAAEALAQAREILGPHAATRELNGFVTEALLEEIQIFGATLLAIGTHGHRRAAEILLGGVAGELLHRAPCSVLVARSADAETFPRAIVVGHDGSRNAADALAVAQKVAHRHASSLQVIVALANVADLAQACAPNAKTVGRHPVPALVDASRDADLVVVGSRGLRGLRALGSVAERVAHQARCSVLVVRDTPHPEEQC